MAMGQWFVGQWIVSVISFQQIFDLCGLKGHIVEKRKDVTHVRDGQRNVKVGLEFRILNSQYAVSGRP